jgi:hypothetical protein
MISTSRSEAKYQMIKLIKSGRTLAEAKAIVRATSMGLDPEYANKKDVTDLASLEGGLYKLSMTRDDAAKLMKVKFTPRKGFAQTKEEHLARWASGYGGTGTINWIRDGNLIRRGPPNKSRPGSSKGKIGRTKVIGADKTLRDFRLLIRNLQRLVESGGGGDLKQLQAAYKSVRTNVSFKGGPTKN